MWYLILTLYLPLQDKHVYLRFDDFRSQETCILAKIKIMEHKANLMKETKKQSFITEITCKEYGDV